MFILHGALEHGKLLIWAEKQFTEIPKTVSSHRQRSHNSPPRTHPFAANADELASLLVDYPVTKADATKALVWLPSKKTSPLPSNPILGDTPQQSEPPALSPWAIWAYELQPHDVAILLMFVKDKEMLAPGVLLGKEFSFLSNVFYFIVSLVVRQRYLPGIASMEEGLQATWSPVFLGQDKQRLATLEKGMPSLCRAVTTALKQQGMPKQSRKSCLQAFIHRSINAFVRTSSETMTRTYANTTHDKWLKGLCTEARTLRMTAGEAEKLSASIQEWQQPLKNASSSPFKMCLRVEEPKETIAISKLISAGSSWNVSYLLQAHDDPSLLVTTKDVWNPKGAKRKVLTRHDFHPRQFVLTSLGMAAGLSPHVESSLHEAVPTGFALPPQDTSTFFAEHIPKLEDAGFGIICPNWWKKNKKLVTKAIVESPPFKTKRQRSIWDDLNADWKVFIGDMGLSQEELYQLALLKDPIVKMRGEWVVLNKEDILKAIEFLEKKPHKLKTALDLLQAASGIAKDTYGVAIDGVEATGWVGEFLEAIRTNSPMELLKQPQNFKGTLRPYQLRGYSWMSFLQEWQLGACLADDMGLGKTPQTLAMIMRYWEEAQERQPTLLVCPTSLTGNWSREAEKFVPELPVYVHHGASRKKNAEFVKQSSKAGLVITSYALLQRDEALLQKVEWRSIILDEAQNIKNAQTKQTKAVHRLQSTCRLALTGTPVENNVGDLWSIMHFLNPGYLGSQEKFREAFFNPIQIERDPQATESLKQLTKPLILRRLKTDRSIISDLPDKIEMKVYCSLTPEQITLYETVVADANDLLDSTEGIERKGVVLATLSKLKQICNHPAHFLGDGSPLHDRSGKLVRLQEMLEEVYAIGDRALIFTQYSEMGELLKKFLEIQSGKEVLFLHGGILKKHRDSMVERFQKEEQGPSTFILSLKAGGVGLNLTRANHVFHFDRWWNPAVENQATDRAFRIGQNKNVQVHKFICNGTLEERIDEMIENKKEVAENVVGNGEGWLTELSTEDLKELWKLQTSAFAT